MINEVKLNIVLKLFLIKTPSIKIKKLIKIKISQEAEYLNYQSYLI